MPATLSLSVLMEQLRDACEPFPIVLGYVFGSHGRGTADAASDIDVAVFVDFSLSKTERAELRGRLTVAIAKSLHTSIETIDTVILQDAPILLQMNVIRSGKVFLAHHPAVRQEYELAVERAYDDEAPFLSREADLVLNRILSHRS